MSWKFALEPYIKNPGGFESDEVIFYDDKVVIIRDKFAKSVCHLLVLIRDPQLTRQHPTTALTLKVQNDLDQYIDRAQDYAYKDFTSRYKPLKLDPFFGSDDEFNDKYSFIDSFIQVGVHSVPSMANLHIHVMTKDLNSDRLKNKKHYNSFTTDFFVNWDKLPLDQVPDPKTTEEQYLKNHDLICQYCGQNFSNKFAKLRQHLTQEFDQHFRAV